MDEVEGERAAAQDAAGEQETAGATRTEHVLEALRSGWGDGYSIGLDDGVWWYERLDTRGGRQEASGPDEIVRLIADDHAFLPVRAEAGR
jgi:hypothetical protein